MTEFSKVLTSISELDDEEIKTLMGTLQKELCKREEKIRREKTKNAFYAVYDLTMFYDYLEIDGKEVYLTDIAESLENLCAE